MFRRAKVVAVRMILVLIAIILPGVLAVTPAQSPAWAEPAPGQAGIILDGRMLNLDPPPVIIDSRMLAPVAQVARALQAQVTWDAGQRMAIVVKGRDTVQITADSENVTVNGRVITFGTKARIIHDRIYAPVWIMECLHVWVSWDEAARAVRLAPEQPTVVERVCTTAFPLRVAWIADGHLCLLDGTVAGSQPVDAAPGNSATRVIGWSPDGQWLAYLCSPTRDSLSGANYLWVVRADGAGAYQVDSRPVESGESTPSWSPQADTIAYSTIDPDSGHPDNNLKIASIATGKVATLLQEQGDGPGIIDVAWAPDGRSLAVSFPRALDPPYQRLHVDRVTLTGDRATLFSAGEAGEPDFDHLIFPWAAWGLKWSPDGRYLAYHLRPNSGSTSTDSVDLQVIDLQHPDQPVDLGRGLHYADWFAWSPDSAQLAYILGEGRFVNSNKRLYILNVKDGKITDCGQQGQVDTDPLWAGQPPYGLLFSRGPENPGWAGSGHNPGVPVPGQRVWLRAGDQSAKPVTSGPDSAADHIVGVSPDGKSLIYLRQSVVLNGSLYLQPFGGGEETELLRGAMMGSGYNGYFYPAWADIRGEYQPLRQQVDDLLARQYRLYRVLGKEITQQSIRFTGARVEAEYTTRVTTVLGVATPEEWPVQKGRIRFLEQNRAGLDPAAVQKVLEKIAFWQDELQGYIITPSEANDWLKVTAELDGRGGIKQDTVRFFRQDPVGGGYSPLDMNDACFRTDEELIRLGYDEMKQLVAR